MNKNVRHNRLCVPAHVVCPSSELIVCVEQDVAKLHEFMTTPSAGGINLSSPERTLSFCKISSLSCLFLVLFTYVALNLFVPDVVAAAAAADASTPENDENDSSLFSFTNCSFETSPVKIQGKCLLLRPRL